MEYRCGAMRETRLLTIPISHFCEKARWALDRAGIPYREVRHMQIIHYWWSFRWARTPFVPVLRASEETVADSTRILHWVDAHVAEALKLYPSDPALRAEVEALEDQFDEVLGVESRRWVYALGFREISGPRLIAMSSEGVPRWERWLLTRFFGTLRTMMRRRLRLSDRRVELGQARIDETFTAVEKRLSDGRRFLTGDRFTAADLTFASLCAPLLLPEGYGVRLPAPEEMGPSVRAGVERYRARPAGAFALRLFASERARRPELTAG
jgi:glutathione S-transferase